MTVTADQPRVSPVPFLGALLLIALCGWQGWRSVSDLPWPFFHDAWRDIGVAQSILEGQYPNDPILRGETHWYNPGTGAVVAAISRVSGVPPHRVDACAGAFVNLLVPLAFFLLAWQLFGPWSALAALAGFVLINGTADHPGLYRETMTYTPWLWATQLGHAPFYGALACYVVGLRKSKAPWFAACGVLWGITFMIHTTPALVMGFIVVWGVLLSALTRGIFKSRMENAGRNFLRCTLATVTAFIISLPYSLPILRRYHFAILNDAPSRYVDYVASVDYLDSALLNMFTVSNAVALFGLVLLVRRPPCRHTRAVIVAWLVTALLFFVQGYAAQLAAPYIAAWGEDAVQMPALVPLHHFTFMLSTLKVLLFGWGVAGGVRLIAKAALAPGRVPLATSTLVALAVAGIAVAKVPAYLNNNIFSPPADYGWHRTDWADRPVVFDWLVNNTEPDAVILCDDQVALRLVMPAARKVVQTISIFMNPYVAYAPRQAAQSQMLQALRDDDQTTFLRLARQWHVTHVLAQDEAAVTELRQELALRCDEVRGLPLLFHDVGVCIYAVPAGG